MFTQIFSSRFINYIVHLRSWNLLPSLLLSAFLLCSCQKVDKDTVENVTAEVKKTIDQATDQLMSLTPQVQSMTTDEFAKLFVFEYHVVDLERSAPLADIQYTLSELGKERWECFAVDSSASGTRLFLKRRPKSYLRYIPRFVP